jgi:hypothetical protein
MVHVSGERQTSAGVVARRWVDAGVSAVLLQYVPFLYGRRGLSQYPEDLVEEASGRGIRAVVFVHEPWVPLTKPQWLVTGPLQRRQLRRLVRRAAASVTPVPAWQPLLEPAPKIQYVGSTLGPAPTSGNWSKAALPSPVVFSPFGAGLNWEWIVRAVEIIRASPPLIVVGASEAEAQNHPEVSRWIAPGWEWRGRLPADETLDILTRAKMVLAPFVDGITGRRTSVAAALSTGARVISSTGPLFDPFFHQSPVIPANNVGDFVRLAVARWHQADTAPNRNARRAWYDANLDPRALDAQLLKIVLGN